MSGHAWVNALWTFISAANFSLIMKEECGIFCVGKPERGGSPSVFGGSYPPDIMPYGYERKEGFQCTLHTLN